MKFSNPFKCPFCAFADFTGNFQLVVYYSINIICILWMFNWYYQKVIQNDQKMTVRFHQAEETVLGDYKPDSPQLEYFKANSLKSEN
jgi:hypothetical protein